jgi:hypothetical protein
MSAHYKMNTDLSLARKLRTSLDQFQAGKHGLEDSLAVMNQMTDTQITVAYGFADDTVSAAAKAELNADIGGELTGNSALAQMLAQFGG